MNEIRIAKIKPNYLINEQNYPSFSGFNITETKQELINDYINNVLFKGSEIIEGIIQDYQSLNSLTVYIEISKEKNYETIFNSSYLEITINKEKYYYFVNQVNWKNDILLSLVCELDFWLTYWGDIKWSDNGFAFVKRKYEIRYVYKTNPSQIKYFSVNISLDSSIHNLDNNFHFEHKFCKGVINNYISYYEYEEEDAKINGYHKPFYVNQLINGNYPSFLNKNREDTLYSFNKSILLCFGISSLKRQVFTDNYKNLMYYAFITPSNAVNDFIYEDELLRQGNLPNGCFLVPIFLGLSNYVDDTDIFTNSDNGNILYAKDLENNRYSFLANLGNNFVISIVALPLALHLLNTYYQKESEIWNIHLKPYDLVISDVKHRFYYIEINYNDIYECVGNDNIRNILKNILYFQKKDIHYEQKYNVWREPKLFSNQFTEINLNSGNKFITIDNFNFIKFFNFNNVKVNYSFYPRFISYLNFSIAPHLYSQSIKLEPNYGNSSFLTQLTLSENGFSLQQDLQLISSSNSYTAFMTGHKNAYNVSLAQGKLGIKQAKLAEVASIPHGLGGVIGAITDPHGTAFKIAGAVLSEKQAELGYKSIQAQTQDLKAQPRGVNDGNTSDTYGDLIKERFSYFIGGENTNNVYSVNTFSFNSFYQINENQVEIVANYYNLHGYLFEKLMIINDAFFLSRIYFDYFEINMISTAIDKSKGFNNVVLNWFNNVFNSGVRLWHHVKPSKTAEITLPNINDYRYENWEISLFNEV